jgi:hypothetical protein
MANTIQDEIYRSFLEAAQQQTADMKQAGQSLADLIAQADQTRQDRARQTPASPPASNGSSSAGKASSGSQSSGESSVLSEVFGVFKSGLGLSPLVKGVLSLFGGSDDKPATEPLTKYALPAAIAFQGAEVGGRMMNADYDQSGMTRGYGTTAAPTAATGGTSVMPTPQITVNVSAMDARSFLDRSSDIAAAVREAMLNLNSINDVVSEL